MRMFRAPMVGPNSATSGELGTIVARQRALVRNDPWAGAANDKFVSNAIGTGIQARSKNGTKERKAAHKKVWDRWVKVCDADGMLDFYGLQALVGREWDEAGECFARLRQRRATDGLPVPLQIQIIESEQCPADMWQMASNGNAIRAGVEFNAIGKRVAYWMYPQHPGEQQLGAVNMTPVRIPADQIIHITDPLRAGQIRGVPRGASTLTTLFNAGRLNDNTLERTAVANLFAGFFETPVDGSGDEAFGDVVKTTDRDGTSIAGLEPATMQELPPGWKVTFNEPPGAGADYLPFMRFQLLATAARHGVPYEVLTGDLTGVSDRALRLILNEFRRIIEQRQWLVLIPQLCQRVREAFYDAAVLVGAVDAPGYAEDPEEYTETIWVPQGWPYSHPVQDVDADRKAVRAGFKPRSSVVLGNGDDPEEVEDAMKADNERADAAGFVLDSDPRKTSNAGLTQARPGGTVLPSTDIEE
jgi:lambda family phage portal protein